MTPSGTSYETTPEVFLEPIGSQGFAPTDVVVSTDGSLLVSIGGRNTRGAVFRIEYVAERNANLAASNWVFRVANLAEAALAAPQPYDAWSRAYWEAVATELGPGAFIAAAADNSVAPGIPHARHRNRHSVHGGLPPSVAFDLWRANLPEVRARTAWSLGRAPGENYEEILLNLSRDNNATVRLAALDAILDRLESISPNILQQAAVANLGNPDKRVRQAAARLGAYAPQQALASADIQARLTALQSSFLRQRPFAIHTNAIAEALSILERTRLPSQQTDAIRWIIAALGDWNLHNPSVEVYTAYEPAFSQGLDALVSQLRRAIRPLISAGNAIVEFEAARLLGMLGDNDPQTPTKWFSSSMSARPRARMCITSLFSPASPRPSPPISRRLSLTPCFRSIASSKASRCATSNIGALATPRL